MNKALGDRYRIKGIDREGKNRKRKKKEKEKKKYLNVQSKSSDLISYVMT